MRGPSAAVAAALLGLAIGGPLAAQPVDGSQRPPPEASAAEIRDTAREILSRPEFREPPEPLLQRIRRAVLERLADVFDAVGDATGSLVTWVVIVVLVAVVALVLVRTLPGLLADWRRPVVAEAAVEHDDEVGRSPAYWRSRAEAHEAKGEWREALRCRYRALIAELAARGMVDEVPGRTPGEYRAAVTAARPGSAEAVTTATDVFEWAWYGGRPADPGDVERLRTASRRVLELA